MCWRCRAGDAGGEDLGSGGEPAAVVEGLRGKLTRLVERGRLTQDEPGLFALTEQARRRISQ
ncbi:hypothetical protein [Nonomuraea sp. JJY05]|uniref:hypothetical protein n=1 Tax=Nonomuraea sp. JJY05 TaxID=3350255 RepID=UPI00373FB3EA